jgi:hypothetical protein
MKNINGRKQQVTAEQERMLKKVAKVAARRLTPIETHSICVLLSMAFGRGTLQSRTFAWHVNEVRSALGLPQVTQAAAGNPTMEEKMNILRSAMEKLGDDAQGVLIRLLLLSPFYQAANDQQNIGGEEEG